MGEMCRMMVMMFLVQNLISMLYKGTTSTNTSVLDPLKNNASVVIGSRIISESHLQNYLRPGD